MNQFDQMRLNSTGEKGRRTMSTKAKVILRNAALHLRNTYATVYHLGDSTGYEYKDVADYEAIRILIRLRTTETEKEKLGTGLQSS